MNQNRDAFIHEDAFFRGAIRNGRQIDIEGYVEGEVVAETIVVGPQGRLFGTVHAGNAEIHGQFQGKLIAKGLVRIASTGAVAGNVLYGQLAMEPGGTLAAELRNVPPSIAGDFHLVVARGQTVAVTPADLTAYDPDDAAGALTFRISNANGGRIVLAGDTGRPVERFTLAELEGGQVVFVHDGSQGKSASFDVVVADASGATSGAARTVNVSVMAGT